MKKVLQSMVLAAVLIPAIGFAQEMNIAEADKVAKKMAVTDAKIDTTKLWTVGSILNINFSQVTLSNWLAGGQNAITLTSISNTFANYKKDNVLWKNSLELGYGLTKLEAVDFRKSDDKIVLVSNFSIGKSDKMKYSGLLDFRTQFSQGFKYSKDPVTGAETQSYISNFMAPGYLVGGLGMDYIPTKFLTIFLSPATYKGTYVLDDTLSAAGAFGVTPGKKARTELGAFATVKVNLDVMKNVNYKSTLNLFSNYEHFRATDVMWENLITMKVNKLIVVTFGNQMFYDDDVKIIAPTDPVGSKGSPKLQYKQVLNVGVSFVLK